MAAPQFDHVTMRFGGFMLLALGLAPALGWSVSEDGSGAVPFKQAMVIEKVEAVYPGELASWGDSGTVVIECTVGTDGRAHDLNVVGSTHPAFDAPAMEALLKWKFRPAENDGSPVESPARITLHFSAYYFGSTGRVSTLAVDRGKGLNRAFPELFDFDTPPVPLRKVYAVHPYDEVIRGSTGRALLEVVVDSSGVVRVVKIESASSRDFGYSAVAMMEAWTFTPGSKLGKSTWAFLDMKKDFVLTGIESPIDSETKKLVSRIRNGRFTPAGPGELDSKLKPVARPGPVYPRALLEERISGSAVIEFIVDQSGRAVLPRIVESTEPEFGWAAATAVQRWMFEPPTKGRKRVEVRVTMPFKFNPPGLAKRAADEGTDETSRQAVAEPATNQD